MKFPKAWCVNENVEIFTPQYLMKGLGLCKNSSDLSLGRRPESKSEELIESSIFVGEIISIQVEIERRLGVHIFGF